MNPGSRQTLNPSGYIAKAETLSGDLRWISTGEASAGQNRSVVDKTRVVVGEVPRQMPSWITELISPLAQMAWSVANALPSVSSEAVEGAKNPVGAHPDPGGSKPRKLAAQCTAGDALIVASRKTSNGSLSVAFDAFMHPKAFVAVGLSARRTAGTLLAWRNV